MDAEIDATGGVGDIMISEGQGGQWGAGRRTERRGGQGVHEGKDEGMDSAEGRASKRQRRLRRHQDSGGDRDGNGDED